MRYASYLIIVLATVLQAGLTVAAPSAAVICPGPPPALQARITCTTTADCPANECYTCDNGVCIR
ncbi:hypothetical protein DFH07DRAFT_969108 [Mycena maculata]|uniref:Uncharacterized protein n=1 Tax=Mycena maculata TaxID=230809 RepID=A0AAD7MSZ5_9AGAR|nr:hypothetical protein DFH07DRAFT_969108 [Mycena maculata]